MNAENNDNRKLIDAMSDDDFALLGGGHVGYIRRIDVATASGLIGEDIAAPNGTDLFCLYQADGTPMAISSSHDQAIEQAEEAELMTMSVH